MIAHIALNKFWESLRNESRWSFFHHNSLLTLAPGCGESKAPRTAAPNSSARVSGTKTRVTYTATVDSRTGDTVPRAVVSWPAQVTFALTLCFLAASATDARSDSRNIATICSSLNPLFHRPLAIVRAIFPETNGSKNQLRSRPQRPLPPR